MPCAAAIGAGGGNILLITRKGDKINKNSADQVALPGISRI